MSFGKNAQNADQAYQNLVATKNLVAGNITSGTLEAGLASVNNLTAIDSVTTGVLNYTSLNPPINTQLTAEAYLSATQLAAAQSIPNAVNTPVTFDNAVSNVGGF